MASAKAIEKAKQYIADIYHCSNDWGVKVTEADMLVNLQEWNQAKDPGEYCPALGLVAVCTSYWNELCDLYPA